MGRSQLDMLRWRLPTSWYDIAHMTALAWLVPAPPHVQMTATSAILGLHRIIEAQSMQACKSCDLCCAECSGCAVW